MPTYKREPCLCKECEYWNAYIDQYGIWWGYCKKGKEAFPDMQKCEEFEIMKELLEENNNERRGIYK